MQGNLHLLQKANKIEYSRAEQEKRDWKGEESRFGMTFLAAELRLASW